MRINFKSIFQTYHLFYIIIFTNVLKCKSSEPYDVALLMVGRSTAMRFDLPHIGPAIDIAVEKCQNDINVHLNLVRGKYGDTCNETASLGRAVDLIQTHKLISFLGPSCSSDTMVVGRLAAYKGIPLLTGLGDIISGQRSTYTTLIRVSYDLRDEARAILAFLSVFKWYRFALIYRYADIYYSTLADELHKLLSQTPFSDTFECTCKQTYIRNENRTIISDLEKIIEDIRKCARIIVIFGGEKDVREMMLIAHSKKITLTGEYAFIYTELFESEARGNTSWAGGADDDSTKQLLKEAYQSLLIVSLNQLGLGNLYINFSDEVKRRALINYNYIYDEETVNYFTASFHDSVLLLCRAIREYLDTEDKHDHVSVRNGLIKRMKNISFYGGISGRITIDSDGDRIADYALLDQTNQETGEFEPVLRYYGATKQYEEIKPLHWPNGKMPLDVPRCGFEGEGCPELQVWDIITASLLGILALLFAIAILIYRKVKLESALSNMLWKVRWEDISIEENNFRMCRLSISSHMSNKMERGEFSWNSNGLRRSLSVEPLPKSCSKILTGFYKGNPVVVKRLSGKRVELTRSILLDLKIMRETSHENVIRFVGACVDGPVAILNDYCAKGSLKDLLANSTLNLDWMFRYSLITDIISGMCYLHTSEHLYHGSLKSNNCLVDSRFCVKIADFGLRNLKHATGYSHTNEYETLLPNHSDSTNTLDERVIPLCKITQYRADDFDDSSAFLYIAPELLFTESRNNYHKNSKKYINNEFCSQKGDIYSFGIILQEIILREPPFYPHYLSMNIKEILSEVKIGELRPIVPADACASELHSVMRRCWTSDPEMRPEFNSLKHEIRSIMKSLGVGGVCASQSTLTENLLVRMEQYATDLETIVDQRTAELAEEKKKTEELLYQVLPKSVADILKCGRTFLPDFYDSVTIYFSDIVGFTSLCSQSTPMQVVDFLNDLYTYFDSIISDFDVYKIETIGDAYMVVSGLPERNGIEHSRQIARMSIRIRDNVEHFVIRHKPNEKLQLRIGIHTGPCCAGCVGNIRPRFCLFGDAVNTASRMESNGEPLKIHISPSTKTVLDLFGTFVMEPRGEVTIKGKGPMLTYWLISEDAHPFK